MTLIANGYSSMTKGQIVQRKLDESSKISEYLMLIRHSHGFSNREIAAKCGVSAAFVSRALHGKTTSGKQFLASLELLIEVIELRKQLAAAKSPVAVELD